MPWERSISPRTEAVKATVARKADKSGKWKWQRELFKMMNALLREQREAMQKLSEVNVPVCADHSEHTGKS